MFKREIKASSSACGWSQIMKISSRKRSLVVGFKEHCSTKSFSSLPIKSDAYVGAIELPIAVPNFWI